MSSLNPMQFGEGRSVGGYPCGAFGEDAGCHSEGAEKGGWHIEKDDERCKMLAVYFFFGGETLPLGYRDYSHYSHYSFIVGIPIHQPVSWNGIRFLFCFVNITK